jgi:hypothetical protein
MLTGLTRLSGCRGLANVRRSGDTERDFVGAYAPRRGLPSAPAGFEHCYLIEGDVLSSDHALFAGDYEVNAPNSDHVTITTTHGCLLLIINNQRDQMLA